MLYINVHLHIHGKTVGFINDQMRSLFGEIFSFEEHSNDK